MKALCATFSGPILMTDVAGVSLQGEQAIRLARIYLSSSTIQMA